MVTPEKFLLPEEDGLPPRPSQDYVRLKLNALAFYLEVMNTSMREKWTERNYIDLQAGPGKNIVGKQIFLGSPLIALTSPYPATHFWFNEYDATNKSALEQRVSASSLAKQVTLSQANANEIVTQICEEINRRDKTQRSLNLAFLDPEGLELRWTTVEQLARISKMDLIINFSTNGIVRSIGKKHEQSLDQFFGTQEWRAIDKPGDNAVSRRRGLIDFYLQRLEKFGYKIEIDPHLGGDDIAVNNSKNSQVYSMIFASKHELGGKFWKAAAKSVKQPRLF